jgi:hypothetical protein
MVWYGVTNVSYYTITQAEQEGGSHDLKDEEGAKGDWTEEEVEEEEGKHDGRL